MNVNLHLSGELEEFINRLVSRGLAANKTEAIRLAIVKYYEEERVLKQKLSEEPLNQATVDTHWNNPSDEKSSEFYTKK